MGTPGDMGGLGVQIFVELAQSFDVHSDGCGHGMQLDPFDLDMNGEVSSRDLGIGGIFSSVVITTT